MAFTIGNATVLHFVFVLFKFDFSFNLIQTAISMFTVVLYIKLNKITSFFFNESKEQH